MSSPWTLPLSFFLTEKCNESCSYCDIPEIKKPKSTSLDIINKHIYMFDIINKFNIPISLSGASMN